MKNIFSYCFKCWVTSAIGGVLGFIAFEMAISGFNSIVHDIIQILWYGIIFSFVGSIPLFILFVIINTLLTWYVNDKIRYKTYLTIFSIVTWLIATITISGIRFISLSKFEDLFFMLYLIPLLISIWLYNVELEKAEVAKVNRDDILDVEI